MNTLLERSDISLDQLPELAEQIVQTSDHLRIWCFNGPMGAGKTTLIKQVCKQLGVVDEVSSPTFSLVNQYKTTAGKTVYHFDFYRIRSIEEVYDIGYEEYFYSGAICLMEWSEKITELLQGETLLNITLSKNTENTRDVKVVRMVG
jgi:tRNA threonylcarbamoyladenosine biosynthesis protein TsaE